MKYWDIIADNLSKAGWTWGCVSAVDSQGRTIWNADAHRGDGKCYGVRADDKLTAFLELESSIRFVKVTTMLLSIVVTLVQFYCINERDQYQDPSDLVNFGLRSDDCRARGDHCS
jgi:hypothetical protein